LDFSTATKLAAAIPLKIPTPIQCTFHYFHPTSRNVRFILSIILKFHVVVRVEVKLSKEREFLAGNVTITGVYSNGLISM
jgi:hypothetical protein